MKLPRDLSGKRLIRHLSKRWSYRVVTQLGSHVTVETDDPSKHRVVIPDPAALRVGTLNQVLRAVAAHKGVAKSALLRGL